MRFNFARQVALPGDKAVDVEVSGHVYLPGPARRDQAPYADVELIKLTKPASYVDNDGQVRALPEFENVIQLVSAAQLDEIEQQAIEVARGSTPQS